MSRQPRTFKLELSAHESKLSVT